MCEQKEGETKLPEKKSNQKLSTTALRAAQNGMLIGTNLAEQYKLAEAYCSSGFLPAHFDTPAKTLTGMQYAFELGLKPLSGMRQICIIKKTLMIYGNLPLAIVRNSGKLEYIKEYLFDAEGKKICMDNKNLNAKPVMAICKVKRKEDPEETETSYSHQEAEAAHLLTKDAWKYYEKTMLKYRARGAALNDVFGDVLAGIGIAEYHENDLPRDDSEVVVATTEEIKDDLDKNLSDYKLELLNSVKNTVKLLEERDKEFNEARKLQYYTEYIKTPDLAFGTENNLDALFNALTLRLEIVIAELKEKKDDKPEEIIESKTICANCKCEGEIEFFKEKDGKLFCLSCIDQMTSNEDTNNV